MKHHKIVSPLAFMAAALALCLSRPAFAADVKLIANPSVTADSVSASELRAIFLETQRSLPDGTPVQPVFAKSGAVHQIFLAQYIGKRDDDLLSYYRTLVSAGRGSMPKFLDSDADIVRYVSKTKGAIGYVASDFPADGVKVLAISRAESDRQLLTRVEPQYPDTLTRLKVGGTVRLLLTISPNGTVIDVRLLGGNPILADSAISAVKRWIYSVARSESKQEVTVLFNPHH